MTAARATAAPGGVAPALVAWLTVLTVVATGAFRVAYASVYERLGTSLDCVGLSTPRMLTLDAAGTLSLSGLAIVLCGPPLLVRARRPGTMGNTFALALLVGLIAGVTQLVRSAPGPVEYVSIAVALAAPPVAAGPGGGPGPDPQPTGRPSGLRVPPGSLPS